MVRTQPLSMVEMKMRKSLRRRFTRQCSPSTLSRRCVILVRSRNSGDELILPIKRFAHTDVAQTLLAYLAKYKEFSSAEEMKRVVNLLHRQAVRAKAEGLFFKVC